MRNEHGRDTLQHVNSRLSTSVVTEAPIKITIGIEDPDPAFQKQLLDLLAQHAAHVHIDTTWTKERAERLYLALPTRARRIVKEAANRGGYVSADDLRNDTTTSLRGHSGPIKTTVAHGARHGWWPTNMELPVIPQGPGFGKVAGYRIPDHLLDAFTHAANKPTRDW
ncbi:hypothetical protein [Streptomyces sp. NPDC047315]|uniref:hypothetical protein n=1 Tax=Streptomyces sp. NPDC047315 TaxID=3155142 RepID=UPI003411D090